MIEVKKKENESTAGLMRRFSQRIKLSGVLPKVRSLRFRARPKSKLKKKEDALKRAAYAAKIALLKKLGKIE